MNIRFSKGSSAVFVSRRPHSTHRVLTLTGKFHPTTTSAWISHRCRWANWAVWRTRGWSADVYRIDFILPVLVGIFHLFLSRRDVNRTRSYICPIGGAYIADTYWGRYKTVCWSVAVAICGHVIMIISAVPGVIGGSASTGLFILSLVVTGTGAGGFKSNISPLVAEQYRRTKPFITTTKSGERVIVDPTMTTSRIYMVCVPPSHLMLYPPPPMQYFYLFINIGALIGQITMVYAEKVDASLGFGGCF